jgi:hypothetical protein
MLLRGLLMRRTTLLVSVLCLAYVGTAAAAVRVEDAEKDLGLVYRDEPQKIVFRLQNASDDTLYIFDIEPSCDCTTAQVVPHPVGPGDGAEVLVFFDPEGYEGKGRLEEYIRLLTSDPASPELLLTFWVEVGIGPEPQPRAVKFGRICRGESDTLQVSIVAGPEDGLSVLDAYSDTACVIVERVGEDSDRSLGFRVIACNSKACGRVATFVTFVTSDSLRPKIRVPVTVSLVGRIMAEPDIVAFGPTLPGSYLPQVIKIYSSEHLAFDIAEVLPSVGVFEAEVSRIAEDAFELRLKVKEDAPPGRVSGEIRIKTDCPSEPSPVIEVTGYIRSNG